jgi:hypothetical protein
MKLGFEEIRYDPEAERRFNEAQAEYKRLLAKRIVDHPNEARASELIVAAVIVAVCTGAMIGFLFFVSAHIWFWFNAQPQWVSIVGLAIAALLVGLIAWACRDLSRSRLYPVGELVFGTGLATLGALKEASYLAAIVAFVSGVRIVIDGFKRFYEYRSYRLFSLARIKYNWRNFKRYARSFSYSRI